MRFKSRLPEVASAVIFFVSHASDVLVEHFHKPTDVVKSGPSGINA